MLNRIEMFPWQDEVRDSVKSGKNTLVIGGRRLGKSEFAADVAADEFLYNDTRTFFLSPYPAQTRVFWRAINKIFSRVINNPRRKKVFDQKFRKLLSPLLLESRHDNNNAVSALTTYDPESIRGEYATLIILDEHAYGSDTILDDVIRPMLFDKPDSRVLILSTPPNPVRMHESLAKGNMHHIIELWNMAKESDNWNAHTYSTRDNPTLNQSQMEQFKQEVSDITYQIEYEAKMDEDFSSSTYFKRDYFQYRDHNTHERVVVGVDPTGSQTGDECGIIVAGKQKQLYDVLADRSVGGVEPNEWAKQALQAYHEFNAQLIVVEDNFGKEMVTNTIRMYEELTGAEKRARIKPVTARASKPARAEKVSVLYKNKRVYHREEFKRLESQYLAFTPKKTITGYSPDRADAGIWALLELSGNTHNKTSLEI